MFPGLASQKETAEERIEQGKISAEQPESARNRDIKPVTEWPWRRVSAALPRAAGRFSADGQTVTGERVPRQSIRPPAAAPRIVPRDNVVHLLHQVGTCEGDMCRAFLVSPDGEIFADEHLAHTRRATLTDKGTQACPSETRLSGMVFPSSIQNGRARSSIRFCAYVRTEKYSPR